MNRTSLARNGLHCQANVGHKLGAWSYSLFEHEAKIMENHLASTGKVSSIVWHVIVYLKLLYFSILILSDQEVNRLNSEGFVTGPPGLKLS